MKVVPLACLSTLFLLQAQNAVHSQTSGSFFKDKTISVLIGTPPGGGYDLYSRLFVRFIGEHIPGEPNVVAQNRPGAGGFIMAQSLFTAASRDGLTLGMPPQNAPTEEILGNPAARFKSAEFGWIGRLNSNVPIHYVWHTHPAKTIEDVKTFELLSGADTPMSTQAFPPKLLNLFTGTKFRVITGYEGGAKVRLAVESGEIHAGVAPAALLKSELADWLNNGRIRVLVQYGPGRHPEFPSLPSVVELARNAEDREVIRFFVGGSAVGRSIATPPSVPQDRLATLRNAFDQMIKSKSFTEETRKRNIEIDPMSGEDLQKLVSAMSGLPSALVERARGIMQTVQQGQ